jgi:predicted nucleic acid-binding protein
MQDTNKFVLETDILVDHLCNEKNKSSFLIELMQKGICCTTVINASELLFAAGNDYEVKNIKHVLTAIKVLGLNSRYSLSVSRYSNKTYTVRDALFAAVADINNLPVVTLNINKFKKANLKVFHPQDIRG